MMTEDELIAEAKKLGGWELRRGKIIRRKDGRYLDCPITAVAYASFGRRFKVRNYDHAAQELRLPYRMADKIARAADDAMFLSSEEKRLRARLIRDLLPPEEPK